MNQNIISSKVLTMRQGVQRVGLLHFISTLPDDIVMIESGSYTGESTEMFLESGRVSLLYAVDPWKGGYDKDDLTSQSDMEKVETLFDNRMIKYASVVKLKMSFLDSIPYLPKEVDMVYLDGDHAYENILKELQMSLLLVRKGGIIAGHNYTDRFEVRNAVNEVIGIPDRVYEDSSWLKHV